MTQVVITEAEQGKRLDVVVGDVLPLLSRNVTQQMCSDSSVKVNDEPSKPGYKVRMGDVIDITYSPREHETIPDIDLPILYEDDDCIVINKPIGVLSHSKGAFNPEATVGTFIASHTRDMDGSRGGIVHRLDRATSGVIMCAKTPEALSWLQKQFSERKVKKTYVAVIEGSLTPEHAIIDMPIERNPKRPQTFRVGINGKASSTEYQTKTRNNAYTMLELKPKTGRTHQLRVHLAHFGHPIVGDTFYGGKPAERLYLHAERLEITIPSHTRMIFEAPLPQLFHEIVTAKTGHA